MNKVYIFAIVFLLLLAWPILTTAQEANAPSSKDFIFAQYDLRPLKIADEKLKNIVDSMVDVEIYNFCERMDYRSGDFYIEFKQLHDYPDKGSARVFLLTLFRKSYNPRGYEKYCGYLPDRKFDVICVQEEPYLEYIDGPWMRFQCYFSSNKDDCFVPYAIITESKKDRWKTRFLFIPYDI